MKKIDLVHEEKPWPIKPRFNWRHQYDTERDAKEGDLAALHCEDDSLTQQQFTADADINTLAVRFGLVGKPMPQIPWDPSHYGDVSNIPDLRTVLEVKRQAKENFMALPPKLRARFHNKMEELWDFVNDPENSDEAVRLGLLARRPDTPADGPDDILARKIASEISKAQKPTVPQGNEKTPPEGKPS